MFDFKSWVKNVTKVRMRRSLWCFYTLKHYFSCLLQFYLQKCIKTRTGIKPPTEGAIVTMISFTMRKIIPLMELKWSYLYFIISSYFPIYCTTGKSQCSNQQWIKFILPSIAWAHEAAAERLSAHRPQHWDMYGFFALHLNINKTKLCTQIVSQIFQFPVSLCDEERGSTLTCTSHFHSVHQRVSEQMPQ